MSTVFLIGNGFDLNCGMHSSYKDVYKEYVKSESDSDIVNNFKQTIAVLVDIMASKDISKAKDKTAAFEKLSRYEKLQSVNWQGILNTVYEQLYDISKAAYEINYDFIERLGSNYFSLRAEIKLRHVLNTE